MGVSYSVLALDSRVCEWLRSLGVDYPEGESRNPEPDDYLRAIGEIPGVSIREENALGHRCVWVENYKDRDYGWTVVRLGAEQSDQGSCHVWFDKGDPELIVAIAERLTHACGPLVLHSASGGKPIVVHPGAVPADTLAPWRLPVESGTTRGGASEQGRG